MSFLAYDKNSNTNRMLLMLDSRDDKNKATSEYRKKTFELLTKVADQNGCQVHQNLLGLKNYKSVRHAVKILLYSVVDTCYYYILNLHKNLKRTRVTN